MKARQLSLLHLSVVLLFLNIQQSTAQTDTELFSRYIDKTEHRAESGNRYAALTGRAVEELGTLIREGRREQVTNIFFVPQDTTNLARVFELLQQFPNLEALNFYDDGENKITRKYTFPSEILKLNGLKSLKINAAENLDARDTFEKLHLLPGLRALDILDYSAIIPSGLALPERVKVVSLSTTQLLHLNTKGAVWKIAQIEQRGYDDPKDETLLEKLAALNTLETLSFQFCYITSGDVFKKFTKLNRLKIHPLPAKGTQLVKSLSVLKHLKSLTIHQVQDSSQSFSGLEKLDELESLDLRWINRFKSHPEELMVIGKLTKLRSLSIQSCILSICPDFFKTLSSLETVEMKWNQANWSEQSSFCFPDGLYQLPELKSLTVWRTISKVPSLEGLSKLELLDLSANNIQHVPEGLASLNKLRQLFLRDNQLQEVQSPAWRKLTKLESLDLSRNQIDLFPDGIQHLTGLKLLNLSGNKISVYPRIDDADYQMTSLMLDNNKLGPLPAGIQYYRKLQVLTARDCGLDGLPEGLGGLPELRELLLGENRLKTLPQGLADNLNLKVLNLENNPEIGQQYVHDIVFAKARTPYLQAGLRNTGLKVLPENVPWQDLKLVLDLTGNQLKTLPVEMARMKWFNVALRENPLPLDTGFIERGIFSAADAKIVFEELGYPDVQMKVDERKLVASMSRAVHVLSFTNSFDKAIKYARRAEQLDPEEYERNISRYALGIAEFKTGDYKNAIKDLQTHIQKSIYRTWWRTNMAKETEAAIAGSYRQLGQKKKAAETHAFFAGKNKSMESSLDAALTYLESGEPFLSKMYLDSAIAALRKEYLKYPGLHDIYIHSFAEILLIGEKPEEVLQMFQTEDAKILGHYQTYTDYLETAALIMKSPPSDYKKLSASYRAKIAKNGKIRDWNFDNFNRWIKYSARSEQEKQQLRELEALNN